MDEFDEKLRKHNIEVDTNIEPSLEVFGNGSLIYAIFRNLIENSCKYAGKDIKIVVSAIQEDNITKIKYYDTGIGVQESMISRIFERFFRIPSVTSEDYRDNVGSGLGLSVVRNSVAFHGGDIKASCREEGGLEFNFELRS